jgi:hypothetical protein
MVDVEKMKRTFANMIKNAVDAMPKGGTPDDQEQGVKE